MSKEGGAFAGFPLELPRVLADLRDNNARTWFADHRGEYSQGVVEPLRALGEQLVPLMADLDERLSLRMSRPHRDARFSRNKPPYRTEAWWAFRRTAADWPDAPACFFEVSPAGYRWGMGFYAAKPQTMDALRAVTRDAAPRYLDAYARACEQGFRLQGDEYRRMIHVEPGMPGPLAELHRKRNAYMAQSGPYDSAFFSPDLAHRVSSGFAALVPLYKLFSLATERTPPGPTTSAPPNRG